MIDDLAEQLYLATHRRSKSVPTAPRPFQYLNSSTQRKWRRHAEVVMQVLGTEGITEMLQRRANAAHAAEHKRAREAKRDDGPRELTQANAMAKARRALGAT